MALLNQIFGSVTLNYLQLLSISDTALTIRPATWAEQIIAAPKKLDETGIGSRACEAGVEVEESF